MELFGSFYGKVWECEWDSLIMGVGLSGRSCRAVWELEWVNLGLCMGKSGRWYGDN